jgi:Tfp pilus assembly protein PilV
MNTRHRQQGASLIEALVALLVLSLSLVATVRLQAWLRQHSDLARERSEAVQRAQQTLEAQRGFRDLAAFDHSPTRDTEATIHATAYQLQHDTAVHDGLKTEHVTVRWQHRGGTEQRLQLTSGMARLAPVYSALLEVPPQDTVLAVQRVSPAGGHASYDGGRSIVKPSANSRIAWVVDNATGEIQQQCTVAASSRVRELRIDDLAGCEPFSARLVRGFIRFALSATPDALRANDTPLPLMVQTGTQRCESETTAADGERYVAYACAVASTDMEPMLIPQGWTFGLTAAAYKACRYPGSSRAPRNYLVVRGDLDCPSAVPPHNGAPVATVQHQP